MFDTFKGATEWQGRCLVMYVASEELHYWRTAVDGLATRRCLLDYDHPAAAELDELLKAARERVALWDGVFVQCVEGMKAASKSLMQQLSPGWEPGKTEQCWDEWEAGDGM